MNSLVIHGDHCVIPVIETITIREINRLMIKQNHDKIRENLSEALLLVVNCIPLLDGEKDNLSEKFQYEIRDCSHNIITLMSKISDHYLHAMSKEK